MSPATTIAGLFVSPPGPDDEWPEYSDCFLDEWPDEPLEPLPEGLPSEPLPARPVWLGLLEGPNDVLLARHEFTEPVTVHNGDVLSLKWTLGIEGETVSLDDCQARVIRAADIPAQ
jgi:hypothetical protein